MQNSDMDSELTRGTSAENDQRLEWERPALQRLGARDAEFTYGGVYTDGYYFS